MDRSRFMHSRDSALRISLECGRFDTPRLLNFLRALVALASVLPLTAPFGGKRRLWSRSASWEIGIHHSRRRPHVADVTQPPPAGDCVDPTPQHEEPAACAATTARRSSGVAPAPCVDTASFSFSSRGLAQRGVLTGGDYYDHRRGFAPG